MQGYSNAVIFLVENNILPLFILGAVLLAVRLGWWVGNHLHHKSQGTRTASDDTLIGAILGLMGLLSFAGLAAAQKTQLLVYTALETDQLKAYQEGFNKVEPNIDIKWVRDSTGVITAKLLAEKANPSADVVMGVAASIIAGVIQKYRWIA